MDIYAVQSFLSAVSCLFFFHFSNWAWQNSHNVISNWFQCYRMWFVYCQKCLYQIVKVLKSNRSYGTRSFQTQWLFAWMMECWAHTPSKRTVSNSIHWINQRMHGKCSCKHIRIDECPTQFNWTFVLLPYSCACWSPKGKQIVVAFPNGKLAQYKPDLKLAKTIPCTVQLLPPPFSPVAIQWLSTYQFAVVFVEDKEDAAQCMLQIHIDSIFAQWMVKNVYFHCSTIHCERTEERSTILHQLLWHYIQSNWSQITTSISHSYPAMVSGSCPMIASCH